MNTQQIRDATAELQQALDSSRVFARQQPSGKAPVVLSDDRVQVLIDQLTALAAEADLQQDAFRRIYWRASQTGAGNIAALAIQYANLAVAPAPV